MIRCALAAARTKDAVGVATTISVRWMAARTKSTVALDLIASKRVKANPGETSQGGVRKSKGREKVGYSRREGGEDWLS